MEDSRDAETSSPEESEREGETPRLRVENITKRFGNKTVVDRVSFEVYEGEVVGLLGRNGAGKTTSFKMTIGLLKPDRGDVYLSGDRVTDFPMYRRSRRGLGYLPQQHSLIGRMTIEENLRSVLEVLDLNREEIDERIDDLLEEFNVEELKHQKASTLSGGETRRVEICRTIATDPDVILLDEPFSGVDPIAVSGLQDLVLSLRDRSIGILLTDHNVRETLQVTDRSYIIDEGRILAQGSAREIVDNELVRKVYLGENFSL